MTILALLKLYLLFFKIGIFTFGGGYAMIPFFQDELVTRHGFLTAQQFADIIALAQMTPGPVGLNAATYVGQLQGGFAGALACTAGVLTPSLTVGLIIAAILARANKNALLQGALTGIRPATVGLIGAAVIFFAETSIFTDKLTTLWKGNGDFRLCWSGLVVFALTIVAHWRWKPPMLLTIVVAGVLGWLLEMII